MHPLASIKELNESIGAGRVNCAGLVATAVNRSNDPSGRPRTFVAVNISAEKEA